MEYLPVEIIGDVLSRIGGAREAIVASTTCRKWREAFKNLHMLSFNSKDRFVYHILMASRLEMLITQTVFQTTGLQGLSISIDEVEFSTSTVVGWLMHTRESLCQLIYNVKTSPNFNILDVCGRQKLEVLKLSNNSITGIEPNFHRCPCLRSLSLSDVSISSLDLNLLLRACPKIENLELFKSTIEVSDAKVMFELRSTTLKTVFVGGFHFKKFKLEAECIEYLHFSWCELEVFELIGKFRLKHFKIADSGVTDLNIGAAVENLEILEVIECNLDWPECYQTISKSSKLRRLELIGLQIDNYKDETVDFETIATCFPQLSHLSLSYDPGYEIMSHGMLHYDFKHTSAMKSVVVLEIRWNLDEHFSGWVEEIVTRCPNLKKLTIFGRIPEDNEHGEREILGKFTTSMVQLMRRHMHVNVIFDYYLD